MNVMQLFIDVLAAEFGEKDRYSHDEINRMYIVLMDYVRTHDTLDIDVVFRDVCKAVFNFCPQSDN